MKLEDWITPDNYHLSDILANGRCLRCGCMSNGGSETYRELTFSYCSDGCKSIIKDALDECPYQPSPGLFV